MKKMALLSFVLGLILIVSGFLMFEKKEEETITFTPSVHTEVSKEDEKLILDHLKIKYDEDFEVVEHTTNYCTYKENELYKIDYTCEKNEVINNIYEVKNSEGVTFYVRKVNVSENSNDYMDNSTYDNYVTFNVSKKIEESLKPTFEIIGEVEELNVYCGMGIDLPDYKKVNDKYEYYVIYQNLDRDTQSIVNKGMEVSEYIASLNRLDYSNDVKIRVKINKDIDSDSFKEIVKIIKDNDFNNFDNGLEGETILFEFNNKIYIKYENGFTFKLLKYDKNILEDEENLVYDKKITIDYSDSSDDSIFYDDFMALEVINLNI